MFYKKTQKFSDNFPSFSFSCVIIVKSLLLDSDNIEITQRLVERARGGDQQSMYRLYKMYVQAMYNTCIRIVANQFDAEDILQESFVSAFNGLESFKGECTFGAWLKRIVINKSLNHLRKQKSSFTDVDNLQLVDDVHDEEDFPEISPEMVHEAIKSLPEKARVVLNLYLMEGYMHKEIADMLSISESTSKSQYQRARTLLQTRIKEMIELKETV